jgi:hypothetical protein
MADIDKSLPNTTRTSITIPGEEEISQAVEQEIIEEQQQPEEIEVIQTEDGGAEISFDPSAVSAEGGTEHFANLAEVLGDEILNPLGSKLTSDYMDYIKTD